MLRKLDLQEFSSELKRLAPSSVGKELPRQSDVALYVRAFYSDPDMFIPFVKENQERLTQRQIVSIIHQGFGKSMKTKMKKDLIAVCEAIYERRRQAEQQQ
jgi:hypothetical protein